MRRGERLADDVEAARDVEVAHAAAAPGADRLRGDDRGEQRHQGGPPCARGNPRNGGGETERARPLSRERDGGRDVAVGGRDASWRPLANAVDDVREPHTVRRVLQSGQLGVARKHAGDDRPKPSRRGSHREALNDRAPVDPADDRPRPERERDVRMIGREPTERARVLTGERSPNLREVRHVLGALRRSAPQVD